ncbi:MAG: hypothetical protein RLY40_537 [Pseudomonadota bacterium]|jgi:hypothetical protein
MDCRKNFISIWNEIKKFPGFMGKNTAVDQLNDTTIFPWFLNFSKNFSADYRKCKSSRWDFLISLHNFKNLNTSVPLHQKKSLDKKYLTDKYNERLLFYSKDKTNPWVIDDRDEDCLILHKKNYLEFEKKLSFLIDIEIDNKLTRKALIEKDIPLERKRLSNLVQLALLKTYREESFEEFTLASPITCSEYQIAIDQFKQLITEDVNSIYIKNEIKKIKKQQEQIAKELYVYFEKETETIRICTITSIWEKINRFVIKNKPMQFFLFIWYGFVSHAGLLNWISFLLLFFSLSLYSYPIIFLLLGVSLGCYLIYRIFYLVKKDSIVFPNIFTDEAKHVLELIKLEVFNEEKSENEFKLIHEIVYDLSRKNPNLNEFLKSISNIQKNYDPIYLHPLNIHESKLYQYLIEVYPKTQFIASLTINLTSIVLYIYLLTWAIQSVLLFVGALSLATIIASPLVVGVLILIAASFFLISHLCEFSAREDFYQRILLNKLNEMCEYYYKDGYGKQQVLQIEKWRKFEYLQNNINLLELVFKNFFEENNLNYLNSEFYSVFNNCMLKKNIYASYDQDKVLGESNPGFRKFKKFLNRSFAFFGGGLYGYNIGQQIVWKSNLGLHTLVKIWTLPIFLIFLPLIVINGTANLLTYHLHSRQQRRFVMLNNLDSKLEILEQTNKKLLYLASILNVKPVYFADAHVNENDNISSQLLLTTKNNKTFNYKASNASFFRFYPKRNKLETNNTNFLTDIKTYNI